MDPEWSVPYLIDTLTFRAVVPTLWTPIRPCLIQQLVRASGTEAVFGGSCVLEEVLEPEGESGHGNRTGNEAKHEGNNGVRRKRGDQDQTNHDEDDRGADPEKSFSSAGLKTRRGPGKSLALEFEFLELEARTGKSRIIEDEFAPIGRNSFTDDLATEPAFGFRLRSGVSTTTRARMQTEAPNTGEQSSVPTRGYANVNPGETQANQDHNPKPQRVGGNFFRPPFPASRGGGRVKLGSTVGGMIS